MARPWERPKAGAKARARARARASNGLMCVKEGRPNVMLKEDSERKFATPGGTRTHNLLLPCACNDNVCRCVVCIIIGSIVRAMGAEAPPPPQVFISIK